MKEFFLRRRFKGTPLQGFVDGVVQKFPFPISYKIRDFQRKEISAQFAYSELFTKTFKYFTYREISRSTNNPWEMTKVIYGNAYFRKKVSTIPHGEDPRLFSYRQEPWIYIQIYNELERDVEIRIRNLVTDIEYKLYSPLGFNGKNWVPFEKDDQLHFIYSLEPLVVLRMTLDQQGIPELQQVFSRKSFKPGWETNFDKSIGRIRGGTPGINFEDRIIGFTHQVHDVPNYQYHTLGLFTLNLNNFDLKLIALSELSPGFLIDSYGITFTKRNILLYCSVVEGDLHRLSSDVSNIVFSIKRKTLINWLIKSNENLNH